MQQDNSLSGFELSPVQERLYGVSKGDAAFSCQNAVRIDGALDVSRLQAAVDQVVERYEILRTGFRLPTGRRRPLQIVQESRTGALEILDLSASALDSSLSALRVPALESDAPTRFHLLRLADDVPVLALTFHALCGDAQTLAALTDEILQAYAGVEAVSAEPLQYADFAAWQTELLESEEPEAQAGRAFWAAPQTASRPDTLPYQRRMVGDTAFTPESVAVPLNPGLAGGLTGAPADFLLTCWLSLNFRLTGQEEGIAGLEVDGRAYPELVGAPGLFAKSVPVAWSLTAQTPFETALARLADARQSAEQHQDYFPLDSPSASPLAFAWEALPAAQSVAALCCTDTFGLQLSCGERDGRLVARLRYDAARFDHADMLRLADQLALLADSAAHAPSSAIGCLALLPGAERQHLLVEVNATDAPFPADACIHHLFEQQVQRTPDAPALVCGGERLTYAELNGRANRIAHYLKGRGVGANVPVALCLERSAGMIVGLLAILKAGGYYVPLAADLPAARLKSFLDQSRATLALTQSSLKSAFADWGGAAICLDSDTAAWSALPDTDPEHGNTSDDLVYMIFTSGSTGVPKGVGNRHRGLVNYTTHIAGKVGLSAGDALHVGTVSTLSADLGNTSVFPALAFGGCLHVIGFETAMDGGRFSDYVRQNPLDMLKITPSHLSALLASSSGDILPARFLFLGGEALRWDLLEQLKSRGRCTVINHYGPTETTIGSLTYDTAAGSVTPQESATVPIGRPIANTRIYVLDGAGQPTPIGIVGELFIGGAGLASGYVGAPELTAERFVADPFAGGDARMYKTGDRARFLSDGSVEFLGRIDDQVKIRGFRVEPGEVEAVLRRHAEVREAAVLVADDAQGQKRLAGYFVGVTSPEKLRAFLSDYLPDYMIPTTLTALAQLPLTANGKVDRTALLALEVLAEAPAFEAGRTETEVKLAEIWGEILQQERVGIHDDFFALGGHSLLMTQILARIRSVFQVQLALHTLFDNPTIATLAVAIDGEQSGGADDEEMARLLAELEGLSDDEVSQLLQEEAVL